MREMGLRYGDSNPCPLPREHLAHQRQWKSTCRRHCQTGASYAASAPTNIDLVCNGVGQGNGAAMSGKSTHSFVGSRRAGRVAAEHTGIVKLARAGWAAAGIMYLIAGTLAMIVTLKSFGWTSAEDEEASPMGAVKAISRGPGGKVLLWILALGMVLYAAWRLVSAIMPGKNTVMTWVKRVGFVITAVLYTALAITAVSLSRSRSANKDGNTQTTTLTGRIMSHTAGQFIVGVVGLIVVGVGLYCLRNAAKRNVTDEVDLSGMSRDDQRLTKSFGVIGEFGRGLGIGLVGFFLVRAAITFDANKATGLDGALRQLAMEPWGRFVVAVVAIGFVSYGAFCLKTLPRRRLQAPQ
jgi:hypothetical protein